MILPISICKFDAKKKTMHLNTSPACFVGSGTGKREKKTQNLKKLTTGPEKATRYIYIYIYKIYSKIEVDPDAQV